MSATDPTSNSTKTLLILGIVAIIIIIAVAVVQLPDRRTPGEKIGDAISDLSNGVKDAGRDLGNRTPADKIGDAVKDAGDSIRNKTGQ